MTIPTMTFSTPEVTNNGLLMATTLVTNQQLEIRLLGFQMLQAIYKTWTDKETFARVKMEIGKYYLSDFEREEWPDLNDLIAADKWFTDSTRTTKEVLAKLGDDLTMMRIKVKALLIEHSGSHEEAAFYAEKREQIIQQALITTKK